MTNKVKQEVKKLIKEINFNCTIEEFEDKVDWTNISKYQKLSEQFIREFKDKVYWPRISQFQKLSLSFIREFKDKVDVALYKKVNRTLTYQEKLKEAKAYAKKHNLKVNSKYLYAYRNHDFNGSGMYNTTITYKKGQYYTDWHLDMRKEEQNSFSLGIFPEGNTPVRVKISDWGVEVANDGIRGKARVWGFEII